MRIDPKLLVAPVSSATAQKPQQKTARSEGKASVVSLSSAGAAVVGSSEDEAMSPRVERLKQLVEAGSYKVDLDTLASRIIDDEVLRGTRS